VSSFQKETGFVSNVRSDFLNGVPTLQIARKYKCRGQHIVDLVKEYKWERIICPVERRSFYEAKEIIEKYCYKEYSTFVEYRYNAQRLMRPVYYLYKNIIDPKGLKNEGYSIDHKLSVYDGWRYRITLMHISHPANLRMLLPRENSIKGKKSSISTTKLAKLVNDFSKNNEFDIFGDLYNKLGTTRLVFNRGIQ
jgi:hypothetical protein